MRTKICTCVTCKLYYWNNWSYFSFNDTKKARCELCKKRGGFTDFVATDRINVQPGVKEFFQCEWICEFCVSTINMYVVREYKQCWAEITMEALQMILCKMLLEDLSTMSYRDVTRKAMRTRYARELARDTV